MFRCCLIAAKQILRQDINLQFSLSWNIAPVATTFGAVPFALWLDSQVDTRKVKPLDYAVVIIAANHFSVADLLTNAISGFIRVNWIFFV